MLRSTPEDFVVEEIPAYLPSGEGSHLYLKVQKRGMNTTAMAQTIAKALGVDPRGVGYAGMKDRHAVTTQWVSLPDARIDDAERLQLEHITILEAGYHRNKLRTGHLRGNRFCLRLRNASGNAEEARALLETLSQSGVPNYFGEQRFGHRNWDDARAWLEGKRKPRGRFQRKLWASVAQSEVFNRVVVARVKSDTLHRPVRGDVFRKEDSGGLFQSDDMSDVLARLELFDISPTGPLVGPKMTPASEEAADLEATAWSSTGFTDSARERLAPHAPGGRRALRCRPCDVSVTNAEDALVVDFTLPKGCYATVVMRELCGVVTNPEERSTP